MGTKELSMGMATLLLLSGCAGTEIVNLAYQATVETFTIQYRTVIETKYVSWEDGFNALQSMTFKRHGLREESACVFDGVLIPWVRTWKQKTISGGVQSVLPPDPKKIAGYAAVVYSKKCPGQPEQKILHVGPQEDVLMTQRKAAVLNNRAARTMDLFSSNQDLRPKWVPQVVERATKLASSNGAAKSFIVSAQDQLAELLPEQSNAIRAAAIN